MVWITMDITCCAQNVDPEVIKKNPHKNEIRLGYFNWYSSFIFHVCSMLQLVEWPQEGMDEKKKGVHTLIQQDFLKPASLQKLL